MDEMLDAAQDRRFKPLGLRAGQQPVVKSAAYAFSFTLEPAGHLGDRKVLELIAENGLTVEPVAGTPKMRIGVPSVQATSQAEATDMARQRVRKLVPANGCQLSEPEPVSSNGAG